MVEEKFEKVEEMDKEDKKYIKMKEKFRKLREEFNEYENELYDTITSAGLDWVEVGDSFYKMFELQKKIERLNRKILKYERQSKKNFSKNLSDFFFDRDVIPTREILDYMVKNYDFKSYKDAKKYLIDFVWDNLSKYEWIAGVPQDHKGTVIESKYSMLKKRRKSRW